MDNPRKLVQARPASARKIFGTEAGSEKAHETPWASLRQGPRGQHMIQRLRTIGAVWAAPRPRQQDPQPCWSLGMTGRSTAPPFHVPT